jgi:hypothetical protein
MPKETAKKKKDTDGQPEKLEKKRKRRKENFRYSADRRGCQVRCHVCDCERIIAIIRRMGWDVRRGKEEGGDVKVGRNERWIEAEQRGRGILVVRIGKTCASGKRGKKRGRMRN